MATIQYNPLPTVSPTERPVPYRTAAGATPEAFGAGIGQAMEGFGRQLDATGNMIEKQILAQQQLVNESAAKEADINAAMKIGEATNQFYVLQGKNAHDAYPGYQETIKKIRDDSLEGLNPMARKMADVSISRRAEFAQIDGGRHTAQQEKVYENKASTSRVDLAVADAGLDPYNETRWNTNTGIIKSEIRAQAEQHGLGKESYDAEVSKVLSKAWQTRINSIAQRDPFSAKEFYDKHSDEITDPVMRNTIEQTLIRQANVVGTRIRADQIEKGGTYEERLNQQEGTGKNPRSSAVGGGQFLKGTWDDLRARHPELNLTPEGRADPAQTKAALSVFTAENQTELQNNQIEPNQKNTYMAHFLGAGGAVKFIKGMEANPDVPATSLVEPSRPGRPGPAESNPTIFFNRDGTPRSAQEVYNLQTARFGGPDTPLSGKSSGEWLQNALAQGRAMAQHDAPDDPEYAQLLEQRITNRFNQAKNVQRLTDKGNFDDIYGTVIGNGDPAKYLKSVDDIFGNQQLNEKYQNLPPPMQQRVLSRIAANAKPDVNMTPERVRTYQSIMGMAITDPQGFQNIDSASLDLPWREQDQIFKRQQSDTKKLQDTSTINKTLGNAVVKATLQSVGFPPDKADDSANKRYNQFIGALNENLTEYAEKNKKQMPMEEQQKLIGNLIAEQSSSWFGGSVKNYQVPSEFKDKWLDPLTKKLGHAPTDVELGAFYKHYTLQKAQDAAQ